MTNDENDFPKIVGARVIALIILAGFLLGVLRVLKICGAHRYVYFAAGFPCAAIVRDAFFPERERKE
jgi:hypothetical protein